MSAFRPIDQWLADEVLPHEGAFFALARRLSRTEDEADDLVQEALAKLLPLDGWAAIANPRSYVLRTIQNLAMERMRRARIVEFQQLTEIDAVNLCDEAPDAFRVAAGRDQVARLSDALAALPERCRTVLVRRRFRDQSAREIASDLGISVSTLEKRLTRALYLLGRALEPSDTLIDEILAEDEDGDRAAG